MQTPYEDKQEAIQKQATERMSSPPFSKQPIICSECQEVKRIDLKTFILAKTENQIIKRSKIKQSLLIFPKCSCEENDLTL